MSYFTDESCTEAFVTAISPPVPSAASNQYYFQYTGASGSTVTLPGSAGTSASFVAQGSAAAPTSLTFTGGALIATDGTSLVIFGQSSLHSGTYGVGGANYDISAQTPGFVALGACFPILVDASSDYGNLSPLSGPAAFTVASGADFPTVFSDPICNTAVTNADLLLNPPRTVKLLYSKATSKNSICTFNAAARGSCQQSQPASRFLDLKHPNHSLNSAARISSQRSSISKFGVGCFALSSAWTQVKPEPLKSSPSHSSQARATQVKPAPLKSSPRERSRNTTSTHLYPPLVKFLLNSNY